MTTTDSLERERLVDNLVDRQYALESRTARLEEMMLRPGSVSVIVPAEEGDGQWVLFVKDMGGEIGPVLVMREL